jgi:ankyrin repeat protein
MPRPLSGLVAALTLLGTACGSPRSWSALSEAVARNDAAIVKTMLEAGPASPADSPHELMMWAARHDAGDVIALLASRGVDVNERDAGRNRWTPLQHAVHTHQKTAVRVLLDWGADPNAVDEQGRLTPLLMAAGDPDPAIVQLLLASGANPRYVGEHGDTPLTRAVSGGALSDIDAPIFGGCRTATVRALLSADPDLHLPQSRVGRLAIWWARFHDCEEVLSLVRTWTSHTAADKIVTAGGVVKDALGVPTPKDVLRGTPARDAPSPR